MRMEVVVQVIGHDVLATRILDAFRVSVDETMQELEAETKARVRKEGADADRDTGNLIWTDFTHFTTRPVDGAPDPDLHAGGGSPAGRSQSAKHGVLLFRGQG